MENSLDLYKKWIFNAAKSKKILISQLDWPSRLGIEIKDYIVQVVLDGEIFVGHGSDVDSDLAILKATSEAYERYCVTSLKLKNSNGCAAHTSLEEAKEKSLLELIERDCFLVKFINGFFFEEIGIYSNMVNLDSKYKLTNYCLAAGVYKIILTRIEINKAANILGLSAELSIKDALIKSEIEALRQLMYVEDKNLLSNQSYDVISRKDKLDFNDHGNIALTQQHYSEIDFIFDTKKSKNCKFDYFDQSSTVFKEYKIVLEKTNPFYEIPLFFVKALNPNAQELFVGKTIENINPLRIPNTGNLNLCLHPFR